MTPVFTVTVRVLARQHNHSMQRDSLQTAVVKQALARIQQEPNAQVLEDRVRVKDFQQALKKLEAVAWVSQSQGRVTLSKDALTWANTNPHLVLSQKSADQLVNHLVAEGKNSPKAARPTQQSATSTTAKQPKNKAKSAPTPAELSTLETEVLQALHECNPERFEKICLELLGAMGYGTLYEIKHQGGADDGGIDGVLREKSLGLGEVYLQAKRYREGKPVGECELSRFLGVLSQFKSPQGLYVTTSDFTVSVRELADNTNYRVRLIHGVELAQLMVKHRVGLRQQWVLNPGFFKA